MTKKPTYQELEKRVMELERHELERKQAQKELQHSNDLLRAIIEAAPVAIFDLDLNGNIHSIWNPAAEKMLGWKSHEVLGKPLPSVPEDRQKESRQVKESILNGKTLTGVVVDRKRSDGTSIQYSIYASPLYDAEGNVSGNISVLIDLTDRIQMEAALKESKKRFSTIFHNNPGAISLTQMNDNQLFEVNEAWQHMTGYSRSDAIGHTPTELNLWYDLSQREKLIKKLHDGGKARDEVQVRRKSGEIITVLFSAEIIEISGEGYLLSMAQDLSDQKNAEEALKKSETSYRNMMDAFVDPLYICAPDFTVDYLNPAMIQRTGRDACGEKCYYALHGLDSKCDWCAFDKVLQGNNVELNIQSPLDGRNYRVNNMPIQNENGSISKMAIYRDITDFLKALSEKDNAQKQLIQSQKMESIGNLAGGIAHDFNNILSSIIGFTELILDEVPKDSTIEDSLQEVYLAGIRAKELVSQILTFARKSDEKRSYIQPSIIAKEVLKFIRSIIPTTIEVRQKINSGAWIKGNATQVHQVLMNLCTNAAHAMEESNGVLKLSVKDLAIDQADSIIDVSQGDYIQIEVSDTGVGIPSDIIGSIFEPYFTTKEPGEGTGLGLALVHGVIESYGGKITVDSQLDKGTTFTIYLPVAKKQVALREYFPEKLPSGTESVLFVDDELPIVKIGSRMLGRLGYSVTTRTSSIEALELFKVKHNKFDLIVTDMTMPNLTGDKLAIEMMKIRPDIPIILCSGYSKKISDKSASEIGIKAFLHKPLVKPDLAKIVRKVLDEADTKS